MSRVNTQSEPKIAIVDEEFLHSLLSHVRTMIGNKRIKSKIDVSQLIDSMCEQPEDGSFATSSLLLPYLPIFQTLHLHHLLCLSLQFLYLLVFKRLNILYLRVIRYPPSIGISSRKLISSDLIKRSTRSTNNEKLVKLIFSMT